MISLIHATWGRPKRCLETRERWLSRAGSRDVQHIFCLDADDLPTIEAVSPLQKCDVPAGGPVRAWNEGARILRDSTDIFVALSDDFDCPDEWACRILERITDSGPHVLAVSDEMRVDRLLTLPILTKQRWIDQGCEIYSSDYYSMYCDNEFTWRAYRDNVVIEARDLIFRHDHKRGLNPDDATYAATGDEKHYRAGKEMFAKRNPDAEQEFK